MTSPLDARLRRTLGAVAACGAALALASWLFCDGRTASSVAAGAAIATANLWALARIVAALLGPASAPEAPEAAGPRATMHGWAVLALLKMGGLFAVVWFLMRREVVSPIPMLAGFAALPLGIAIGSVLSDRNVSGQA